MANEITLTASLSAYKSSVMSGTIGRSITGALFTMTGLPYIGPTYLSVPTSATVIPVGGVTAPHWAWFKNLDATNFITIRNGLTGAAVVQLLAGEESPVPLFSTGTYYALADTAACILEYMIFSL